MVFKKNMKKKLLPTILFILLMLIFSSCKNKNVTTKSFKEFKPSQMELNVKEYRVEVNPDNDIKRDEAVIDFENALKDSLVGWANNKFILVGNDNLAKLVIDETSISLISKNKRKGLKSLLSFSEERRYQIITKLYLNFYRSDKILKRISINASLDFNLHDNLSIINRRTLVQNKITELLKSLDKSMEIQLIKNTNN